MQAKRKTAHLARVPAFAFVRAVARDIAENSRRRHVAIAQSFDFCNATLPRRIVARDEERVQNLDKLLRRHSPRKRREADDICEEKRPNLVALRHFAASKSGNNGGWERCLLEKPKDAIARNFSPLLPLA